MPAVDFTNVVHATDVSMRDLARDAHFAMKASQRGAVAQQVIGQKFKCDRLAEFQIVGAIDLAHAAFAEQPDDAIAVAENCARNKSRVIDRIEGN